MRKTSLITILFLMFLFVGCASPSIEKSYLECVEIEKADKALKAFITKYISENGIYNYSSDDGQYFFLNCSQIKEGDKLTYIDEVSIVEEGNVASIYFNENYAVGALNETQQNKVLYRMYLNDSIDTIAIYRNNIKTFFNVNHTE